MLHCNLKGVFYKEFFDKTNIEIISEQLLYTNNIVEKCKAGLDFISKAQPFNPSFEYGKNIILLQINQEMAIHLNWQFRAFFLKQVVKEPKAAVGELQLWWENLLDILQVWLL